jgi:hypothetical protein
VDYDALTPEAQLELAEYAERYKGNTVGIGRIDPLTGLWRPLFPCATVTGEASRIGAASMGPIISAPRPLLIAAVMSSITARHQAGRDDNLGGWGPVD